MGTGFCMVVVLTVQRYLAAGMPVDTLVLSSIFNEIVFSTLFVV